jgi:hypothetical protein
MTAARLTSEAVGFLPAQVIPFKRRRRRSTAPFSVKVRRRREIEAHAKDVGAADTDDLSHWLIAWLWNLPRPKSGDRIFILVNAAFRMGRRGMTETEAAAIIAEADSTPPCRKADELALWLGLTYQQRERLGITTIGSSDVGKRARLVLRKRKNRMAQERRRRAAGASPRAEYEAKSTAEEIRQSGMSRRTFYRRKAAEQARNAAGGTGACTAESFNGVHGPVPHKKGVAEEHTVRGGRAGGVPHVPVHARLPRWLPTKRTRRVFSALTAIAAEELRRLAA